MSTFDDLFFKALAAAEKGDDHSVHSSATAKILGSRSRGIADYVPFHRLSSRDQSKVRGMYPYKKTGGKYDFVDEHYFYPVKKDGSLFTGRGAQRVLAFSRQSLVSGDVEKFGYSKNPSW